MLYNVVMAEESARVAQRCETGKESLELLLDGCDLRKFPDAVFFLMKEVELRRVSLAHNQLQRIPSKLGLKFTTITGDLCTYNHTHCRCDHSIAQRNWSNINKGSRETGLGGRG